MFSGYYVYRGCIFNDVKHIVVEMKRIYEGDVETANKDNVEFISIYKTTPGERGIGEHPYRWIRDFDTKDMWTAILMYEHMIPLVAV